MRLIIAGSRTFTTYKFLEESVIAMQREIPEVNFILEIVSGGANGVDKLAEIYAHDYCIPIQIFKPIYDESLWPNKLAPLHRNAQMAEYGDALLALWDGLSGGTANMIANMCLLNKPVFIVKI